MVLNFPKAQVCLLPAVCGALRTAPGFRSLLQLRSLVLRALVLLHVVLCPLALCSLVQRSFVLHSPVLCPFVLRSLVLCCQMLRSLMMHQLVLSPPVLRLLMLCSLVLRSLMLRSLVLRLQGAASIRLSAANLHRIHERHPPSRHSVAAVACITLARAPAEVSWRQRC